MSKEEDLKMFCGCGGCTAKIGPEILSQVLKNIPKSNHKNLLIGYDSSDDAAVYKLTDDIAIIQTLDFFTPIVEDPYTFGKIAATNALSDVYAMGGEVLLALNIVCFSEKMDPDILGEILKGGAEKVIEAGGVLCGGHSVNDKEPKYGLSVTGWVHPDKILANNNLQIGDKLILTKPLGIGIVTTAKKMGEASDRAFNQAVAQMEYLNKYAAQIMTKYNVHAATDVTGFGFLGHMYEMTSRSYSIKVDHTKVPYIPETLEYAKEFYITAAGQKNRNHIQEYISLCSMDFAMEEILFDPQTSGGLLISVAPGDADALLNELNKEVPFSCAVVGEVVEPQQKRIIVQ